MCIAIAKKKGVVLTDECLKNSYEANRDGCGVAWIDQDNTLQIYKSLSFTEFLPNYRRIEEAHPESDMLIHFRIKTHGKVDLDNCHPFVINDDMVMMHNGTISNVPTDTAKSDTRMFVEHYLKHLKPNWEDCEDVRKSIELMIGWSKVVVLHRDKGIIIFNESKGTWVDDVWYSNDSYKRSSYKSYEPNYGYYGGKGAGKKQDDKEKGGTKEHLKSWEVDVTDAILRNGDFGTLANNLLEYKKADEATKPSNSIKVGYVQEEAKTVDGVAKVEVSRFDMNGNFLFSTLEDRTGASSIVDEGEVVAMYDELTVDKGKSAEIHRKCTACDEYHIEERLIADPTTAPIVNWYCIGCIEEIYSPTDIIEFMGVEMTFYEYLIDCQQFTDVEIIEYLARYDAILEEMDDPSYAHEREYIARKLL